jgi:hypothetical protein
MQLVFSFNLYFITQNVLEKHKLEHTLGINNGSNDCFKCDQKFSRQKLLQKHVKETHNEVFDKSSQTFKCTFNKCEAKFEQFCRLLSHRRRHFEKKTFKCSDKYPSCEWTFFTAGELTNHQLWTHNSDKPFKCDWDGCEQRFKLRNLLSIYIYFVSFFIHILINLLNLLNLKECIK